MTASLKIGCVVMAAGNASRFGSNKLTAKLSGETLFSHTLHIIPSSLFQIVIVVTQYREFLTDITAHGFLPVWNFAPERGQSHTIQLGLTKAVDCDGVLFLVSDQPLLQRESIVQLVEFWSAHPEKIAALAHEGHRGNPCIFPARFFPELLRITGDHGGSSVIRAHPEDLILLNVAENELYDIDTVQELKNLT